MTSRTVGTFLFLFLLALSVRTATVLLTDFDGLYGQDAFAYYENAKIIHNAFPDLEAIRNSYWPVGKAAPIGYPAVVALAFLWIGVSPLAGQIVSLIAGSLVPPLLFLLTVTLLANSEWSEKEKLLCGLLAGLLGVFSGALVRSSIVVMADALGQFLATLSVLLAFRYVESGKLMWMGLTAFVVALSILVRTPNILIGLVIFLYIFLYRKAKPKIRFRHIVVGAGIGIVVLLPQVLIALYERPAMITESAVASWNPLNAFRTSFFTASGRQSHPLPNFLFYLAPVAHPAYLGPLTVPAVILGTFQLLKPETRRLAILLGSWVMIYYLVLLGIPYQNFRYTESFFPPLAILASVGFVSLLRIMKVKLVVLIMWMGMTLASMGIFGYMHLHKFLERKWVELQVAQWVEREASSFTNVLSFAVTFSIRHYSGVEAHELYYQDTTSLKTLLGSGGTLMVADFSNIETQWKNTRVFEMVKWIREHYVLEEVGNIHNYTAFWIKKP